MKKLFRIVLFSVFLLGVIYLFLTVIAPPSTVTTETNEITTLLKSVQAELGIEKPIMTGPQSLSWRVKGKRTRTKGYYFDIYDDKSKLEMYIIEIDSYILSQGFVRNDENTIAPGSEKYYITSSNEWETKGYEKGSLRCKTYIRIQNGYISFGCGMGSI